jgi:hypothetical protein
MRRRQTKAMMGHAAASAVRSFGLALVCSGLLTAGIAQAATSLGPTRYQSFENKAGSPRVSPFSKAGGGPFGPLASCPGGRCITGTVGAKPLYFYLEDLLDGAVNTPGVTVSGPPSISLGAFGAFPNSVDEDDGTIDGKSTSPYSLFRDNSGNSLTLTFAPVQGRLPTHAGFVLTDGSNDNKTAVEAFDALNQSLGTVESANQFAANGQDATNNRFFGFSNPQGISKLTITSSPQPKKNPPPGFEIDHIQYGFDPVTGNAAPTADAGPDQLVNERAVVTLDGLYSSDPDGDPLTYQWAQTPGLEVTLSDPTAPQLSFVALNPPPEGVTLTFRLTVSDGLASSIDVVNITVQNVPPTANAGGDLVVTEGTLVTLDGSASTDPGGDTLIYSWQQLEGPTVVLSDPTSARPSFTVPLVDPNGTTLTFELSVFDGAVTQVDTVTVVVQNVNAPPVADAGPDQFVGEEALVSLDGSASDDADHDALSYLWRQIQGTLVMLSDASSIQPWFTAPQVGPAGETLVFELTVDDGALTNADVVAIVVQNVNTAPIANAGLDQAVDEGAMVTLDGSGSADPDGDALSYRWEQMAGSTTVALSDPTSKQPSFSTPLVGRDNAILTFQLTVFDGLLSSPPAVVNIKVKNVNHPPVADAGDDQTIAEGVSVQLTGSHSYDPDSDLLSYQWEQIDDGPAVTLSDSSSKQPSFTAPLVGRDNATLTFRLTVSDGVASATDTVIVVVENVNHVPAAQAGDPQLYNEGSVARLNGTLSSDPDGDPLNYHWRQISGPVVALADASTPTPSFVAPPVNAGGVTLEFELVVDDGLASSEPALVVVKVQNINDPPSCEDAYADTKRLWPPDHKLVPVKILNVTDPNSTDKVTITVTGVTSDEPVNGLGDGDTSPDAVGQATGVLLRAERAGSGNGRVYRVSFTATDNNEYGGNCAGTVMVTVPQSMKAGSTAGDEGGLYDAMRP